MEYSGNLIKMSAEHPESVQYLLKLGENSILMNDLIGENIQFTFNGIINCINCGKITKKSFSQGFCYNCFLTAPQADPSVVNPELDMAHLGISRDMEWAKTYSLVEHYVYLAFSSNIKVGVTRSSQVNTRWIDQGAKKGVILAKTPYRNLAGQIEVAMKQHFADKTNWRSMLSDINCDDSILLEAKNLALNVFPSEFEEYFFADNTITELNYPVKKYPEKVKSISLDNLPKFNKKLVGIKGQYLIFDDNTVMNIRKHNGYFVEINF